MDGLLRLHRDGVIGITNGKNADISETQALENIYESILYVK
jgi:hypothetical protein